MADEASALVAAITLVGATPMDTTMRENPAPRALSCRAVRQLVLAARPETEPRVIAPGVAFDATPEELDGLSIALDYELAPPAARDAPADEGAEAEPG